jgi:hypothetical protein
VRARRQLERLGEPVPDVWAAAADVCRAELEQREARRAEVRLAIESLSGDAWAVVGFLHGLEHGRTFLERLRERVLPSVDFDAALDELCDAGLLYLGWAVDQEGEMAELIVTLRYDVELPGTG